MASFPEEWQSPVIEDAAPSAAEPRRASRFWRYYWIVTGGCAAVGLGLAFSQLNPNLGGLLIVIALALMILGLIPSLLGTAEKRVGDALSLRLSDYQHRWSSSARRWWYVHWVLLLVILILIIVASNVNKGQGQELFLILIVLLSCVYMVIICIVLAWRWRRMRLAALAGLEELQSFELMLDNEEFLGELSGILPIFGGKKTGRCPVLMRRSLGGWTVLLFDWLDINKQPPRHEWITIALIGLHQPLPMLHLQPTERVNAPQLHWWHIFIEFPFGLIIFIVSALSHVAKQLKSKPPLTIAHSPGLTRGYLLETYDFPSAQKVLSPEICQSIIAAVHRKKRFLMVHQEWLLLAGNKREIAPRKLGELVADAIRLTDGLERAKGS